jgi:AraC-like DNA-binding protein
MIENLNALSSGHYGRVLKEADLSALEMLTAARPTIDIASAATTEPAAAPELFRGTLSFAESNNMIYKVTGGSLLLDIIEGQAVLIVSKSEEMLDSQMFLLDKESMITNVDGVTYSLKKGDVIFYGPGQYHSQMAEHDVVVSFVTVTFDMDMQNPEIIQNKVFQISREQANLLDKVLYEREHSLFFSEDLILCYLKELIITMIRADRLNISEVSLDSLLRLNIENHVADAAGEFILNNICSRIAVADIAAAVNVSSSYLSVMFKKRKGMTLIEFVNHHKLERSRQMIKDGKHNFTEISELLGFNSVHYFSRQFKNKYGLTPTDYERALR